MKVFGTTDHAMPNCSKGWSTVSSVATRFPRHRISTWVRLVTALKTSPETPQMWELSAKGRLLECLCLQGGDVLHALVQYGSLATVPCRAYFVELHPGWTAHTRRSRLWFRAVDRIMPLSSGGSAAFVDVACSELVGRGPQR